MPNIKQKFFASQLSFSHTVCRRWSKRSRVDVSRLARATAATFTFSIYFCNLRRKSFQSCNVCRKNILIIFPFNKYHQNLPLKQKLYLIFSSGKFLTWHYWPLKVGVKKKTQSLRVQQMQGSCGSGFGFEGSDLDLKKGEKGSESNFCFFKMSISP